MDCETDSAGGWFEPSQHRYSAVAGLASVASPEGPPTVAVSPDASLGGSVALVGAGGAGAAAASLLGNKTPSAL